MRVFTYVIVHDSGAAPQLDPPCTLAICKPRIRLSAHPGNLVLAFTGQSLGPEPHSVRWAGVVREKLTFSDYWNDPRFAHKKPRATSAPDNVYRPVDGGLLQVPNAIHDASNVTTDLGGRYALVFEPAWYFGTGAPILPESFGLRMTASRRGHRVIDLPPSESERLLRWLGDTPGADSRPVLPSRSGCAKERGVPRPLAARRRC